MARAATTTDVFNAIAEPRRRQIIDLLSQESPRAVGDLATALHLRQPTVSKHLGVLRQVGVVSVARQGQHRLYHLNGQQLKPIHDWVKTYERFWTQQLKRIKERAERTTRSRSDAEKHKP
jgi:DNA-binding transcriptional ArsR family regulator